MSIFLLDLPFVLADTKWFRHVVKFFSLNLISEELLNEVKSDTDRQVDERQCEAGQKDLEPK
jgi:hypothetical protein